MADNTIVKSISVTAASVAAVLVAAFALLTGGEKASMLGLTRHGELVVAVDAGGPDVVGLTGITPGTPTQVLTVSDSGVPVWRAPASSSPLTTPGDMIRRGASADERLALGASGTALRSNGTAPVWTAAATAGLDSARPSATVATLGALYTATDTGVRYVCESDGAGGARWAVQGARGSEGRDTTAVLLDGAYADTSVNVVGSTVVSYAVVFAQRSIPTTAGVLLTVNPGTGTDGTYLDIGRDAGDRYLLGVYRYGFSSPAMPLTGATISGSPTALHCIAVTLSGATVRYSLDGAAVSTVSSGTGAATVGTAPLRLGKAGSTGTTAVDAWLVSAVAWSTAVGDADLAAVSGAAKAAGTTPGRIPAVSGATEIARWHAGSERTGIATNAALGGSLGGNLTWTAAPSLVIR